MTVSLKNMHANLIGDDNNVEMTLHGRRPKEHAQVIFRPAVFLHVAVQCRFTSLLLLFRFCFFSGPGRSRTSQCSGGCCG